MTTNQPNPQPLKTALGNLAGAAQQVTALRAKLTELQEKLSTVAPLNEKMASDACTWSMQLGLIPARIDKLVAQAEAAGIAIAPEIELFHRALQEAARAEHAEKLEKITTVFRGYIADRTDAINGEVTSPARNFARHANVLAPIPLERVGTGRDPMNRGSAEYEKYNREIVERAEELLAIHAKWEANGGAFGGPVPSLTAAK